METASELQVWIAGRLRPLADATVSAFSPSAQFGITAFEGIRAYRSFAEPENRTFRLVDHLDRLSRTCGLVGMSLPLGPDDIEAAIVETLRANGHDDDAEIRVLVLHDEPGTWSSEDQTTVAVRTLPRPRVPHPTPRSATISPWRRISATAMLPEAKVGANYLNSRYALRSAREAGFDTALLLNDRGQVAESTGAAVVTVTPDGLISPPPEAGVLDSITVDTVFRLAESLGIPARRDTLDPEDLLQADEVFLCGTAAEITPIGSIDGALVGDGSLGRTSAALLAAYHDLVSGRALLDPTWLRRGVAA